MTTKDNIARRKLGLLELAKERPNVSRACRALGYSRQQFCEIRRNFQTFGLAVLIDRQTGAKEPHPNRVAREIEDRILKEALERPTHGALRVSQELQLEGFYVSSGGVRGVCDRGPVGLDTLAVAVAEEPNTLSEVYEPYLIQEGFLLRTPRGRVAALKAYRHLGLVPPKSGENEPTAMF